MGLTTLRNGEQVYVCDWSGRASRWAVPLYSLENPNTAAPSYFCSFGAALAWLLDSAYKGQLSPLEGSLHLLALWERFGRLPDGGLESADTVQELVAVVAEFPVEIAPHYLKLTSFGGTLTPDEWAQSYGENVQVNNRIRGFVEVPTNLYPLID